MKTCLGDHLHTNLGFACQRPQVFAEVRYGLAPSVVQRLDFEDIREGRAGVIQVDPQTRVVQHHPATRKKQWVFSSRIRNALGGIRSQLL